MTAEMQIDDPRNHSAETVLALQDILSNGATLIPDSKRRGFYEVHSDALVYYIHVSPASGNILLLATWPNQSENSNGNIQA
ncbi:MAG TPA: hypothetical protein VEJ38_12785 [Candidatus Acidoferrales bacterium]|nr:hypothetical protein [Candidatus Acidoferrales bacterium]